MFVMLGRSKMSSVSVIGIGSYTTRTSEGARVESPLEGKYRPNGADL